MNDNQSVNKHLRNVGESVTFAIDALCKERTAHGKKVFRLGLGQSPFPIPEHVVQALKQNANESRYQPVQGIPELREAVARFHRNHGDGNISPENVMIGPGSKELLFLLQLAFNGEIIIPTPSWVSYAPQARIIGHRIRFVHTKYRDRWRLLPEQLEKTIRSSKRTKKPRLLILNYPGNPCGLTYSPMELSAIADVARSHKLIILSDEIYAHLHHSGRHTSIARYYPEGTIISSGLSKWCGAGGWRLGTFAFPPELGHLMRAMIAVASETYSSTCAPIQYAAVQAFTMNEHTDRYVCNTQKILRTLGRQCADILRRSGIDVHEPEGGFYLFPDFSKVIKKKGWRISSGVEMTDRLLKDTGVAVIPGHAFNRRPGELSARLAYVDFDGTAALNAAYNIPDVVQLPSAFTGQHCAATLEAMERIARWVS